MVLFAAHHKQMLALAPTAWQHPYVNVFKHFGVGQWKKCSKEGDVSTYMVRMCSKLEEQEYNSVHTLRDLNLKYSQ